jgi:putative membrane protein
VTQLTRGANGGATVIPSCRTASINHRGLWCIPFFTDLIDNPRVIPDVRQWFGPERSERVGETPDYRYSLANERTFLAWIRTALALVAGGLACAQFLRPLPIAHLREGIAIALLVLGGLVALRAVDRWSRTERAMRLQQDLPPSRFPAVLAILVALGSVLLVITVLIQAI